MEKVDLQLLMPGSLIEVQEAAAFPIKHNSSVPAFLCTDAQMRLVTTTGGELFGGPSREALVAKLNNLGFKALAF